MQPLFSILHPSARPHKWREIYEAWIGAAAHPENVEYVLCADERWGFDHRQDPDVSCPASLLYPAGEGRPALNKVVWNTARRCYVDSVNIAAKASTGRILIVIADDQYPCDEWDKRIEYAMMRPTSGENEKPAEPFGKEWVMGVSTGTPDEYARGMMVMPILSRARYERLGYVFYPEYESMYADNDFCEHANQDGCIIDARHLMFPHRHPLVDNFNSQGMGAKPWYQRDEVYAAQNRPEAYELGERILKTRRESRFGATVPRGLATPGGGARPASGIALCFPGNTFSRSWVEHFLATQLNLMAAGHKTATFFGYTSQASTTREAILQNVKRIPDFNPEFILWVDDDQLVEPWHVEQLLNDARQFPDVDMFCGWTFIAMDVFATDPQASCGRLNLDKVGNVRVKCGEASFANSRGDARQEVEMLVMLDAELQYADWQSMQAAPGVFDVTWSGFPLALMRASCLEKVGPHPFAHIPAPNSIWGHCGEDVSFCVRLAKAGGRIMVDTRVFVPHLKLRALGPQVLPKEQREALSELALKGKGPTQDPNVHVDHFTGSHIYDEPIDQDALHDWMKSKGMPIEAHSAE